MKLTSPNRTDPHTFALSLTAVEEANPGVSPQPLNTANGSSVACSSATSKSVVSPPTTNTTSSLTKPVPAAAAAAAPVAVDSKGSKKPPALRVQQRQSTSPSSNDNDGTRGGSRSPLSCVASTFSPTTSASTSTATTAKRHATAAATTGRKMMTMPSPACGVATAATTSTTTATETSKPWTEKEMDTFCMAFTCLGGNSNSGGDFWDRIQRDYLPHRTVEECRDYYDGDTGSGISQYQEYLDECTTATETTTSKTTGSRRRGGSMGRGLACSHPSLHAVFIIFTSATTRTG